ncbi:MAG: ABC transporter permease [Candidatus Asgardarchaeia archaeon]
MLFLKLIASKRVQLALLIFSLALASGLYIGVSSGRDLIKHEYTNAIIRSIGYTDFVIKGNSTYFFYPENVTKIVDKISSVGKYIERIQAWYQISYLPDFSVYSYVYVVGINPQRDFIVDNSSIVDGQFVLKENSTLISEIIANLTGLQVGDSFFIRIRQFNGKYSVVKLNITGIVRLNNQVVDFDKREPSHFWTLKRAIIVNLSNLQKLLGDNKITHVYIHVNNYKTINQTYNDLKEKLEPAFAICNLKRNILEEAEIMISNVSKLVDSIYLMGSSLSIFVIIGVLYQYLLEWKYYIGVIKTLGASNFQIFKDFIVSIVALSAISVVFGIGLAQIIFTGILSFAEPLVDNVGVNSLSVSIEIERVMEGSMLCIVTSLIVASLLILLFLKRESITSLLGREKVIKVKHGRLMKRLFVIVGLLMIILGKWLLDKYMPKEVTFENLNIAFVGLFTLMFGIVVFVTPLIVDLIGISSKIVKRFPSLLIATRNIKRYSVRTFFLIIIVTFTFSFILGGSTIFLSIQNGIKSYAYMSVGSDISIDGYLPANLTREIATLSGVKSATEIKVRWGQELYYQNQSIPRINIYGVNATTFFTTIFRVNFNQNTTLEEVENKLKQNNTIILQDTVMKNYNISIGDTVTWRCNLGKLNFTVIGAIKMISGFWETLYLSNEELKSRPALAIINIETLYKVFHEEKTAQRKINRILIKCVDSDTSSVMKDIKQLLKENAIIPNSIVTAEERIKSMNKYYTPFFGLFQVMMSSFILLSFFLVASNFAYVVIERKYELGILKCLGLSKLDLIKIIIAETILDIFTSSALGLAIGNGVMQYLFTIVPKASIFPLEYIFPTNTLLFVFPMTFLLALTGGFIPAIQLFRKEVTGIIRD